MERRRTSDGRASRTVAAAPWSRPKRVPRTGTRFVYATDSGRRHPASGVCCAVVFLCGATFPKPFPHEDPASMLLLRALQTRRGTPKSRGGGEAWCLA